MTIHIATAKLIVLELEEEEYMSDEQIRCEVIEVIERSRLEEWSSMEIELYSLGEKKLIFAVPIKLYIPEILTSILKLYS